VKIEQRFTVNASRAETAAFFADVDRVAACVPGVEGVTRVGPNDYEAVLTVGLGPIRAAFKGALAIDESESPIRLRATGEGRDRATGSMAKVDFVAELEETSAETTEVMAVADVMVRGRMAQFGTGVFRAAAKEVVNQFSLCANEELARARAPRPSSSQIGISEARSAPPRRQSLARIAIAGIWQAVLQWAKQKSARIRGTFTSKSGSRS
jgi:carbon monoxide dehydrogenase subunit G